MDNSLNPYASPPSTSGAPPLVTAVVIDDAGWTIDYELLLDDYVAWNLHYQRTSPAIQNQLRRSWLMIGAVVLGLILLPFLMMDWPRALVASALIGIPGLIAWAWIPRLRRRQVQQLIAQTYAEGNNFNLVGPRRMAISREYLVLSSPWSQSLIRWVGIAEIRREPEAVYFCISSATAFIVPRRAFASGDQFEQFAQAAAGFLAGAKPSPVG